MTIDSDAILIGIFGGAMTIITSVASYKITKYFKSIEISTKIRERKQEIYYMKHDATIYALAVSLDKDAACSFNKHYKDKLNELEREQDKLKSV